MANEWTYDQVVMLCETDGVPLPEDLIEWMAEKLTMAANRAWDDEAENRGEEAVAFAVPVEIEHLQKGYRNSAVVCNRNEGAYTMPVYLAAPRPAADDALSDKREACSSCGLTMGESKLIAAIKQAAKEGE